MFFPHYGFAEHGNPNEHVEMTLNFTELAIQEGLVGSEGLPEPVKVHVQFGKPSSTDIVEDVLARCRQFVSLGGQKRSPEEAEAHAFRTLLRAVALEERRFVSTETLP